MGVCSLPKFPLLGKQQPLPPGLATSFWSLGSKRLEGADPAAPSRPVLDMGRGDYTGWTLATGRGRPAKKLGDLSHGGRATREGPGAGRVPVHEGL